MLPGRLAGFRPSSTPFRIPDAIIPTEMTWKSYILAILLGVVTLQPGMAQPVGLERLPDTQPGRVAERLFTSLASDDPSVWRDFIELHFTESFRDIAPIEMHIGVIGGLHDESRGYEVLSIDAETESRLEITAKALLTGELQRFILTYDEHEPSRLTGLGVRSAEAADTGGARYDGLRQAMADLDLFLHRLDSADVFSGAVLVARGGRPIFVQAYGEADKAHHVLNHVDTRFSLGSMNKMFTAVAIMQLVERGRLSLDDPVSKYVPGVLAAEAGERVQLKHLLSHTSGLGDFLDEASRQPSGALRTIDDFVGLVRGDTLRFEPEDRFSYSNAGFVLLGKIVEVASETDYYAYVREHIYEAAGMSSAGTEPQDSVIPHLAVGYDKEYTPDGIRFRNNRFSIGVRGSSAGGGYASIIDLMKFAAAFRDGTLLSPESVDLLTTAKPDLGSDSYGYGFVVNAADGIVGHSGGFAGVSANLDMFSAGYDAVVLSNYRGAMQPVRQRIRGLVEALENGRDASKL